jgi:DNA methylase
VAQYGTHRGQGFKRRRGGCQPIQPYVTGKTAARQQSAAGVNDCRTALSGAVGPKSPTITTLGWQPSCACEAPVVPCTVLDPFGGSGTVGAVAEQLGRHSNLIELSPEYVRMAERRTAQRGLFAQETACNP